MRAVLLSRGCGKFVQTFLLDRTDLLTHNAQPC
jgi:hypothetical protein